jgi:GAF domain-containing protein
MGANGCSSRSRTPISTTAPARGYAAQLGDGQFLTERVDRIVDGDSSRGEGGYYVYYVWEVEVLQRGWHDLVYDALLFGSHAIGAIVVFERRAAATRRRSLAILQRYAADASWIYATWRQLRHLSAQSEALQEIMHGVNFQETAANVARETMKIFRARTVTFWPHDSRRQTFRGATPATAGFDEKLPEPRSDGTTAEIILTRQPKFIEDIENYSGFVGRGRQTYEFLKRYNIESVAGIPIFVGDEPLGVLYVGYLRTWPLPSSYAHALSGWSTNVATVLYRAQLFDTEHQAKEAAERAANYLARGGTLVDTLGKVAADARQVVRCDTVTIHQYDYESGVLIFPPVSAGVRDPARMEAEDEAEAARLVPSLIDRGEHTMALNLLELRALFAGRFIEHEGIRGSVAVRLEFEERRVGLMFFSFCNELRKSAAGPVLDLCKIFARAAAVAIGRSQRSETLAILSGALLNPVSSELEPALGGSLDGALQAMKQQLQVDRCNIVFREGKQLRSVAEAGWGGKHEERVEEDSHAGFTINQGRPVVFTDINEIDKDPMLEGFHPPVRLRQAGITSGITVPLHHGNTVVGALLAHAKTPRMFSSEDVLIMGLIANQVVIAYIGAQRTRSIKAETAAAKLIADPSHSSEQQILSGIRAVLRSHLD